MRELEAKSNNKNVSDFLIDLQAHSTDQYEIVSRLRDIALKANPDLHEGIKYGGIAFQKNGKLVGGIYVYKEHVSFEFSEGSSLDDTYSVLEGSGKLRRHIKFYGVDDIKGKSAEHYISEITK